MNIFLIRPCPSCSAKVFLAIDPVRARKQLLECCQILATVDHILFGATTMLKADGSPYGKAHPHHPITKRCAEQVNQYRLCLDVAASLADRLPKHACTASLNHWLFQSNAIDRRALGCHPGLLVCRKGLEPVLVGSREEYANVMSAYLATKIERDAEKSRLKV